LCIFLFTQKEK